MSETAQAPDQGAGPTLNVMDIQNAVAVIDHAADNGAFRTWDTITKVLDVRNKLAAFAAAAAPPQPAEGEQVAEAAAEPAAPKKPAAIKNPAPKKKAR